MDAPIVFHRYPASYLCDVVYSIQPMTSELAELVRILRRDHKVGYRQLGFYLCVSDPDSGGSFGLGRALTEMAAMKLNDFDPAWL